jgi:hypothetical protein
VDYQNGEARFGKNLNQGNAFLSLSPVRSAEWFHVTIWATEIINRVGEEVPSQGSVLGAPQTSMLRARVRWSERMGYERSVDVDIGMGVDLWVPPTPQIEVMLLVPNPASVPQPVGASNFVYPDWFTSNGEVDGPPGYQFSTAVTAAAYPVCSPVETNPPNRLTYTAFPSQGDGGAGNFPLIPIPPNARRCQMSSVFSTTNPIGRWLFDPSNTASVISSFGFPAGSLVTENVLVPQHAKALRLLGTGPAPRLVTVNFELQQ